MIPSLALLCGKLCCSVAACKSVKYFEILSSKIESRMSYQFWEGPPHVILFYFHMTAGI